MYLLAGKVITPAKISTNKAISKLFRYTVLRGCRSDNFSGYRFWVALGDMISKINPTEACVDFIASNVSGNRQGEQVYAWTQYTLLSSLTQYSFSSYETWRKLYSQMSYTCDHYWKCHLKV